MNKRDLFNVLKYEFFNRSKNIDDNINLVCTNLYTYVTKDFMFNRWIKELFINKEKFWTDLDNDENVLFMERLFCGISYIKNPENIETIERIKKNIIDNKKVKSNRKVEVNLEKIVYGKEYLEKKKSLLQLIFETKEEFDTLSEKVFEIIDLVNQIKDLVLQDSSLQEDYLEFINNEKVKYIIILNDVCNYIITSETKLFSYSEKVKNKIN